MHMWEISAKQHYNMNGTMICYDVKSEKSFHSIAALIDDNHCKEEIAKSAIAQYLRVIERIN